MLPAAAELDWFCPLNHFNALGRERMIAAATHEARQLGLVTDGRLTALGEHLVAVADEPGAHAVLARRVGELLPAAAGQLLPQSDLTAVASGQPSAAMSRLLAETAVAESREVAAIWRFTPESIRGALDSGWCADELRAELASASGRPLPQPLDYLIGDVARRHGSVRVREVRSCVTGEEAEVEEILHTRSLRGLRFSRPGPTVLVSPLPPGDLLPALRGAGFAPMHEDADGVVVVAPRKPAVAAADRTARLRAEADADDLAARLLVAGTTPVTLSTTEAELVDLAPDLDEAETALLADGLDHGRDVRIGYRNAEGNHTIRDIRPKELRGRWLTAWCHLLSTDRVFTLAQIESVAPFG